MMFLGHLGVGSLICKPVLLRLPAKPFLLGSVFPDLIDKPLYYGLSLWFGKTGADLGWITGTRTLGHTGIFILLLTTFAVFKGGRVGLSFSLGVFSHLVIDVLGDGLEFYDYTSTAKAILYPLMGGFHVQPVGGVKRHLAGHASRYFYSLGGEVIGGLILLKLWMASKRVKD